MVTTDKSRNPPDNVQAKAIDWYVKLQSKGLSARKMNKFESWLTEHPKHQIAFDKVCETMDRMSAIDVAMADSLMPAQSHRPSILERVESLLGPLIEPHIARPVLASLAAILIVLALVAPRQFVDGTLYETARGELETISLADGSIVHLNTATRLIARFNEEERRIILSKGEAYFEVGRDENRPFIVQLPDGAVRAVGTAFNIHLKDKIATVTVAEGIVQILDVIEQDGGGDSGKKIPELHIGEQILLGDDVEDRQILHADIEIVSAWMTGKIIFKDEKLGDVIDEFTRYSNHWFIFWDPSVKEMRVSGTFNPNDIDSLNAALEIALDVKITTIADSVTLLSLKN